MSNAYYKIIKIKKNIANIIINIIVYHLIKNI